MHWNRLGRAAVLALAAAAVVAGFAVTPAAQGAITASQITTPADGSYFVYNHDTPNTFAISGTTSGGAASDHVDIRCYYGTNYNTVAANVALTSAGAFSVPTADLSTANVYSPCRLRAVPAGTTPSNLTPFAGPRVFVGYHQTYKVASGPNAGKLSDFYLFGQQPEGGFDYDSLSSCGLDDGYLSDSTLALTTVTFYCNAFLRKGESSSPTRSELQIDGANAWGPYTASVINDQASGLPALTFSYAADSHTGDLVIHESEPLVKCTNTTYPPTNLTCPSFVSAGLTDVRTISQDHTGHVSWITDVFKSTDGHSHTLDLLWQNDQHFRPWASGDSTQLEYEFPGQSSYAIHVLNDVVSLPASPGTILIRKHGAPDGDTATGRGAIVYDRPADKATFMYLSTYVSEFTLHQTATVPAGGSTTFRFAYVQDYKAANVASLAHLATAVFQGCTVPKVKGKTLKAAKAAVTHANCTVGKISRATSRTVKTGRVISSKPAAGKHLAYHAKVALLVSKGKKK